jgi:hypothetical protein
MGRIGMGAWRAIGRYYPDMSVSGNAPSVRAFFNVRGGNLAVGQPRGRGGACLGPTPPKAHVSPGRSSGPCVPGRCLLRLPGLRPIAVEPIAPHQRCRYAHGALPQPWGYREGLPATRLRRWCRSTPLASEDLGPGDFVKAEYAACGDDTLIPASALLPRATTAALHACARFGTAAPLSRVRRAR